MLFMRSLIFSVIMIVMTAIVFSVGMFTFPLPFVWRYHIIRSWAVVNLWAVESICGLRYQLHGKENIPDSPCIIFCKHQSTWETMALQKIFPPQVYVIKRELLWVPFFGWALALLNPIAVDRKAGRQAIKQITEQGIQRLQNGSWVVIFPEGTRTAPGKPGRYHLGGAILAAESGFPVVPVAHNAGNFWPRRGFLKHPGTIQINVGPAITTAGRKPEDILSDAKNWIEAEVEKIATR